MVGYKLDAYLYNFHARKRGDIGNNENVLDHCKCYLWSQFPALE